MSEKISFIKRSPLTGIRYDYFSNDLVRLVNLAQIDFYQREFNLTPIDIVISNDRKNPDKKIVVFIYDKNSTKDAWEAWSNRTRED